MELKNKDLFDIALENDQITDRELMDFVFADAELYTLLVEKWMSIEGNKQKLKEWFNG